MGMFNSSAPPLYDLSISSDDAPEVCEATLAPQPEEDEEDAQAWAEQRDELRGRLHAAALFSGGDTKKRREGIVSNVSDTGLCVLTRALLPVGSDIVVSFDLNGQRTMRTGQVVWARQAESMEDPPSGLGVRITHVEAITPETAQTPPAPSPEASTPPAKPNTPPHAAPRAGTLDESIRTLEGFLRASSETMTQLVQDVLQRWLEREIEANIAAAIPRLTAPDRRASGAKEILRDIRALRSWLYSALPELADVEDENHDDTLALSNGFSAVSEAMGTELYLEISDLERVLEAMVASPRDHAGERDLRALQDQAAELASIRRQPRVQAAPSTGVLFRDTDPSLICLRSIARQTPPPVEDGPSAADLVHSVLEPAKDLLGTVVCESLLDTLQQDEAAIARLVHSHQVLSATNGPLASLRTADLGPVLERLVRSTDELARLGKTVKQLERRGTQLPRGHITRLRIVLLATIRGEAESRMRAITTRCKGMVEAADRSAEPQRSHPAARPSHPALR